MNRRAFLGAAAVAGLGTVAGCVASASTRPPRVPTSKLEAGGWGLVEEDSRTVFEDTYGGVSVTAEAASVLYADEQLAADLKEKTLGQVDGQFATFFATRVTFDPNFADLPGGVGVQELVDRTEQSAREQFEARLREAGLTDVSKTGEGTLEVDTGETASRTDYEAAFPFEGFSFPLSEDQAIEVEAGELPVAGRLAVWVHDGAVLIAGGAYPAENFTKHVERDLSSAVTVSVDVDLGLEPDALESEVLGLVTAVR